MREQADVAALSVAGAGGVGDRHKLFGAEPARGAGRTFQGSPYESAHMTCIDLKTAPNVLHTGRLRLESPRPEHAEAFADGVAASMPGLAYVAWGLRPRNIEWALRFCEDDARSVAAGTDLVFHVFEVSDGGWAGRIDVHTIAFEDARGEIGYVGDLRRAGRGLMREASLAVIDLCFGLGFERIEAMSDARNARAQHFADSLGMAREGVLRRHERDGHGELCDMVLYAVLRPQPAAPAAPPPPIRTAGCPPR